MKKKRYKRNPLHSLAIGNIKAGVTLGMGSAITDKVAPSLSGNFGTIAGFMPAINTMTMGNYMLRKLKRKKKR